MLGSIKETSLDLGPHNLPLRNCLHVFVNVDGTITF